MEGVQRPPDEITIGGEDPQMRIFSVPKRIVNVWQGYSPPSNH